MVSGVGEFPSIYFPLTGNRSCDIPVTPTDLNNIHFNRFQNEFHYFSRFHGNSCPAGKYISLARTHLLSTNPPSSFWLLLTRTLLAPARSLVFFYAVPLFYSVQSLTLPVSFSPFLSLFSDLLSTVRSTLTLVPRCMRHKRLLSFCAVYVYTLE